MKDDSGVSEKFKKIPMTPDELTKCALKEQARGL